MDITFMPVTKENQKEIEALHIRPDQKGMVETVTQCLKEASELSLWRPVGIYKEEVPIGFAMYGNWFEGKPLASRVWCDRFFIAEDYQGKGLGRQVFPLLISHIFQEYNCDKIYLSVFEDNSIAIHLYEKLGFYFNGELDQGGEKVMVCTRETFVSHYTESSKKNS